MTFQLADIFRVVVIAVAGITMGIAFAEAKLYLCRIRDGALAMPTRLPFMILLRLAIASTAIYIAVSVGARVANPTLTWRSIAGLCILLAFITAMLGLGRDDQRIQDSREG